MLEHRLRVIITLFFAVPRETSQNRKAAPIPRAPRCDKKERGFELIVTQAGRLTDDGLCDRQRWPETQCPHSLTCGKTRYIEDVLETEPPAAGAIKVRIQH